MNVEAKGTLSVQWHITSKCMKKCRHCYMYESERYKTEIENELSYEDMIAILDDIKSFEEKWGFYVNDFYITGGDPVLNPHFKDFLFELKRRKKRIYIMGNPETLTEDVIGLFKEVGIIQMQMSLDGLRDTHDFYRGKGNFDLTIKALELLDKNDILGSIMFTLTGENKNELIPLLNYVAKHTKAKGFAFDLVCGVGNAKDIDVQLTKEDVKQYLELYLLEKARLKKEGFSLRISEKSKFFQLLHYDNNEYYPYETDDFPTTGGCYVGFTCYTILADGSVPACRRFPTLIGKMPEEKMEDIFLSNELLKRFRRPAYYETCGSCMFYKSCRGCPAVTYGYYGNPLEDNPLCFRNLLKKDVCLVDRESIRMDTTKEEEANVVKSILKNQYVHDYDKFTEKNNVILLIGTLLCNVNERKKFFYNPDRYVQLNGYLDITKKDIAYICYYIGCIKQNRLPNPVKYALDI